MFVQVLVGNVGSSVVYLVEDWCMDNEYMAAVIWCR